MQDALLELAKSLAPVIAPILAGWIATVVLRWYSRLPRQQQDLLDRAVQVAVFAAEQLGQAGLVRDKKQYALRVAQRRLQEYGITVSVQELTDAIEAEVYSSLNSWAKAHPPSRALPIQGQRFLAREP